MWDYDLDLGLPWFESKNPDGDWQRGRRFAMRTPGGAEVVADDRVDHQGCPRNIRGSTAGEHHLSPVPQMEVLVAPMWDYDLDLGLPWFESKNPDGDWQRGRRFAMRTPGGAEVVADDRVDHQGCPRNIRGSTAGEEACSEGGGGIPDI